MRVLVAQLGEAETGAPEAEQVAVGARAQEEVHQRSSDGRTPSRAARRMAPTLYGAIPTRREIWSMISHSCLDFGGLRHRLRHLDERLGEKLSSAIGTSSRS